MIRIRKVKPLERYIVRLEFTNGKQKTVDLEPYLVGPMFEPLRRDPSMFKTITVDKQLGTIVWENGADIDPDVLWRGLLPERMEERSKPAKNLQQLVIREPKAAYSLKKRKRK